MPKMIFRGATIRFVDLRYNEQSKTCYTKINFTADFTEPVREAMEWGEPPAGFGASDLDGEMIASKIVLTPNGKELKDHELSLDAREIGSFKFVRVTDGQEGATHNELRFQVTTTTPDAAALLANYLQVVGKGIGQLRVNYEQQSEMPLEQAPEDKQVRMISEEQAADTAEGGDGEGAALASASAMGGTHQRGARTKQRGEKVN